MQIDWTVVSNRIAYHLTFRPIPVTTGTGPATVRSYRLLRIRWVSGVHLALYFRWFDNDSRFYGYKKIPGILGDVIYYYVDVVIIIPTYLLFSLLGWIRKILFWVSVIYCLVFPFLFSPFSSFFRFFSDLWSTMLLKWFYVLAYFSIYLFLSVLYLFWPFRNPLTNKYPRQNF